MKLQHRIIAILLSLQFSVNCFETTSLKKRSGTSTAIGPSAEDKEILREAFRLMNAGKKTLGLMTESPEQMLQLIESSTEKADQIQQLLQQPSAARSGEQYLVLSGRNGHFKVSNFTNSTGPPVSEGNNNAAEDIFKLVMEKRHPGRTDRVFRRITIIESNQLKPFDDFSMTPSRKRHQVRSLRRVFSLPRVRKKRKKEKDDPGRKLKNLQYPLASPKTGMDAVFSMSSKRKLSEVNSEVNGAASQEISIEKSLLAHLIKLSGDREEKRGTFEEAFILVFLLSLCTLLGILIYRWWAVKNSTGKKNLELKGENIIVHLGGHNRSDEKNFDYQLLPQADLEWQSEEGDWLQYRDTPFM